MTTTKPAPVTAPALVRAAILADTDRDAAAAAAAEAKHHAAVEAARAEADRLRAEYEHDRARAAEGHEAQPPAPVYPDASGHRKALLLLARERQQIDVRRHAALAAAAPDVEREWQVARPALDARARDITRAADDLSAEYGHWHSLLREVRRAAETSDPNALPTNGPSKRMRPRPGRADVFAAAGGADLCAPAPPGEPAPQVPAWELTGHGR